MGKLFTSQAVENRTSGALELMTALAVLIVATLLFAAYGIRDSRMLVNPGAESAAPGKADRAGASRRPVLQRDANASPRKTPAPLLERF